MPLSFFPFFFPVLSSLPYALHFCGIMADLLGISQFKAAINLPGLGTLRYAPTDWVDAANYEEIISSTNNFQKAVPFKSGKSWLTAPVFVIHQKWEEQPRDGEQGTAYEQAVEALVPNLRPSVSGEFALMADRPFLLWLTDRNGGEWLIGSLESGLTFQAPARTGSAGSTEMNDYRLRWQGLTAKRASGYAPVF